MHVVVSPSSAAAAHKAADAISAHISSAIDERGRAFIAVSGGSTPQPMFERLAALPLPWEDVHIFQVDERAVPVADVSRNWLHQKMLTKHLPSTNLHPMPVEAPNGDQLYATEMGATMGRPLTFDVVHLGMGDDGHTASLFPDDPALSVFDHDVVWTSEHRGHRRMTLTLPTLARSRHQVWLATGAEKAPAVHELTKSGARSPAAMVAAGADATLFTDADAAATVTS